MSSILTTRRGNCPDSKGFQVAGRQPPAEALWFYGINQMADVVHVTGTTRKMVFGDGWTFYQMPWQRWAKGSPVNYAAYPTYTPALLPGPWQSLRT
jgi:hypothetical protein